MTMTTYAAALTALIDAQYAQHAATNARLGLAPFTQSRDVFALSNEQVRIAASVFGEAGVGDAFYEDPDVAQAFGTFDNCREYGLTVCYGGWTFCAYEHRNSDQITVEGCPNADVGPCGPYGGENKWDTLASVGWKQYDAAARVIIAAMRYVAAQPDATREQVALVMAREVGA